MYPTTLAVDIPSLDTPLTLDIAALYQQFQSVPDGRKRRGKRYPLAVLLTVAVLGKLAGYSGVRALADWAKLRSHQFAELFDLPRPSMPHATTWTRVFGQAAVVEAVEQAVAKLTAPPASAEVPARGSIIINLDGKSLRGTIPLGQSAGVHLLAAYQVDSGSVHAQVAVGRKTNEIGAAPSVVRHLKLSGVVVTGDAMFAQRELSTQIVEAGGDYFWWVKENQPSLHSDLVLLFDPECVEAGWSAPPVDFTLAASVDKRHGRLEMRHLTASSLLAGYSDWPYLAQAVKVERTRITKLKQEQEVAFGITSLPAPHADAARLLSIGRAQWGIENGLHYRRDVTLREDASQVRRGQAPQVLAALNNLVCGLVLRGGVRNLAEFQRYCARRLDQWLDSPRC